MRRMATSSDSSPSPAPRRGLRYSLRALLIVVTLACIATWYWYRVPYATEVTYPMRREVQRFRRTLWDKPIRHGRTDWFDSSGLRIHEEHWREGELHGPSNSWYPNGNVRSRGQYESGKLHGLWEHFAEDGRPTFQLRYQQGRPHGEWVVYADGKQSRTYRFEEGEAKEVNGQPLNDPLGRAARLGEIDDARIAEAVHMGLAVSFHSCPVRDFVTFVGQNNRVNVVIDRHSFHATESDDSVSLDVQPIPLGGLLVVALEPKDLAATYRFGTISITTKEDAASWVDRTGVTTLLENAPADATEQQRAAVREFLEKPAEFDFVDTPIADVSRFITQFFQPVELKWEGAPFDRTVNSGLRGISMRDALGALCDQHDLRIRWTKGTTLVVEPQEEEATGSK